MLIGRKARKMIERRALDDQFRELEVEVRAVDARDVLDAGSGEGGTAMALGARHPALRVEGVEISPTNVRIARRLNRLANVGFRQGLAEEVHLHFNPESFDLVYSFAVLEHVRDVDETIASMTTVLRPRGRLALVVPMREFRSTRPLPDFKPLHGYADHCRVFTERELRARFGSRPDFRLVKVPGVTKPGELPEGLEPLEFGEFFVSFGRG
jgi:SAM-dependent methyltransferase